MPDNAPPISFSLPDRKSIEAYAVTLKDGRVVLRTKDELAKAPKR